MRACPPSSFNLRGGVLRSALVTACFCLLANFAAAQQVSRSLFIMDRDGGNLHHVIHVAGYSAVGSPRWSHDGARLVFDGRNAKAAQNRFFAVHTDGTNLRDLGPGAFADWSPDDLQFAFAAGANDSLKSGLYVQNVDGTGKQYLSPGMAPHWSPDGSQIAFYSGGLKVRDLIDSSTREVLPRQGIKRVHNGFCWSPDAAQLAVVVEREVESRELLIVDATTSGGSVRTRYKGPANDVSWSPDGRTLAVSIALDDPDLYRIYTLSATGDDPPVEIPGQQGSNWEVAYSPDGTRLAFTSSRRDLPFDLTPLTPTEADLRLIRSHDKGGTVYSIGLTPDGRTAFVGGDMTNRGVEVWNTETGEVLRRISMPGVFVAVSPDGRHGACAPFFGGQVSYIDLETGDTERKFSHGATVVALDFSGDGSRLVTSGMDKAVCAFDVATGDLLATIEHPTEVKRVAFSPDGKLIAVTCADRKLYLWKADGGEKVREMDHPACPWGVAFTPDGLRVLTGTGGVLINKPSDLMIQPEDDNTLRVWDVETGKLLKEMKGHSHTISSVACSPDGRWAVTASFDKTVRLWELETGVNRSLVAGKGWATEAVFAADGNTVVVSGGAEKNFQQRKWYEYPDERVRLFRVVSGDEEVKE